MFKALVITRKQIKHHYSTLNRQIISEKSQQNIQYSPQRPFQKQKTQLQQSGRKLSSQSYITQLKSQFPFKISQIQASFKLFHQYQLQKIQGNLNQSILDKKRQEIATLAQFKTNILAVVNIVSIQDNQNILRQLLQVKQEIETIDIFRQVVSKNQNQKDNISKQNNNVPNKYQSQMMLKSKQNDEIQKQKCSFIIYFKNSIMSEQFFHHFHNKFLVLTVYLKQVIIFQRKKQEQLSYQQVLNCFKYSQSTLDKNTSLQRKQNDLFQRQWIQLPKCPNCLLKLQFQVSGIDQKLLNIVYQNKQLKGLCATCDILEKHRIQAQSHRKLSHQEGCKDHIKSQQHAHCDDCKQKSDIWICMICGRVGCGRYKNADAFKHFVKSGHIITIDLQTQRVWNYLSDCFSHKLFKNVKQSNVRFPQLSNQQGQNIQQSTLQAAFWQYCSVFSQQMQRQRIFYQNIKTCQQDKFKTQLQLLQTLILQLYKQKEQKYLQVKKSQKQRYKLAKKNKELEEKISDQRDLLKDYDDCLNMKVGMGDLFDGDEDVLKKKKELQYLQKELEQVILQLTN